MMNKSTTQLYSVALLALVCLGAAKGDITHSRLDDSHVITTNDHNYAITNRPSLNRNLWQTVSVNGDSVVIITPSCKVVKKSLLTMTVQEKNLINVAKNDFKDLEQSIYSPTYARIKVSYCRFSPNGGEVIPSKSRNVDVASLKTGELSIQLYDEDNYSLTKTGLPHNLARIFVHKDVVTFTYKDGKIEMKPQKCLTIAERLMLREYKTKVLDANKKNKEAMEAAQKNMEEMQNYMQDMQQAMQEQMAQNMFLSNDRAESSRQLDNNPDDSTTTTNNNNNNEINTNTNNIDDNDNDGDETDSDDEDDDDDDEDSDSDSDDEEDPGNQHKQRHATGQQTQPRLRLPWHRHQRPAWASTTAAPRTINYVPSPTPSPPITSFRYWSTLPPNPYAPAPSPSPLPSPTPSPPLNPYAQSAINPYANRGLHIVSSPRPTQSPTPGYRLRPTEEPNEITLLYPPNNPYRSSSSQLQTSPQPQASPWQTTAKPSPPPYEGLNPYRRYRKDN